MKVESGYALIRMAFTERHHNIYGRCHGGAIFSLIDEAFQIASNSSGKIEIALNVNVSYMKPPTQEMSLRPRRSSSTAPAGSAISSSRSAMPQAICMAACQATAYRRDEPLPFL